MNISFNIDTGKKKISNQVPGAPYTQTSGGYIIEEDYTPPALQSTDRIKTFYKMKKQDSMVRTSLLPVFLPIRSANWSIVPAGEDKREEEIAGYVEQQLFDNTYFDWSRFLKKALNYLVFGFYAFAKYYKVENGRHVLYDLEERHPLNIERWIRNPNTRRLSQVEWSGYDVNETWQMALIDRKDLVYFVNDDDGDDLRGESILRSTYGPWWRKDVLLRLDAIKHERYSVPTPIGELPEGYTKQDWDNMKAVLEDYRVHSKGYLITIPGSRIDFADVGKQGGTDIQASIDREDRYILFSTLTQFINLGNTETGSRAVGEIHRDLFFNSIQFVAKEIATVLQNDLVVDLVDRNFGKQKVYPKIQCTKLQKPSIDQLLRHLPVLVKSQLILPDEELENYMRDLLDLTEKPDEDDRPNRQRQEKSSDGQESCDCGGHQIKLVDGKHFRQFTDLEKLVDLPKTEEELNEKRDGMVKLGKQYQKDFVSEMVKRGVKLLGQGLSVNDFIDELEKIKPLKKTQQRMENDLNRKLKEVFVDGSKTVRSDLAKTSKKNFKDPLDPIADDYREAQKVSRGRARWSVGSLVGVMKLEFDKVMQRQYESGVINSGELVTELNKLVGADFKRTLTESVNKLYGLGKQSEIAEQKDKIQKIVRSEIMDQNICENCIPIDGEEYNPDDPEYQRLASGPNPDCLGGEQCRGVNIVVSE